MVKGLTTTKVHYLAYRSLQKLRGEADLPEHNLRRLVSHATLLDNLMVEIDALEDEESVYLTGRDGKVTTKTHSPDGAKISFQEPTKHRRGH